MQSEMRLCALAARRVRAMCRALPQTSETSSWGHPNWKVGKKTFAVVEVYKGVPSICLAPSLGSYRVLARDPKWYVTPYVGTRGWLSRIVDDSVDWKAIEKLVRESYRENATAKILVEFDAAPRARVTKRKSAKRATPKRATPLERRSSPR
jgi:predicted DNA-binding protein (MmcQ/YjbR family)